MGNTIGSPKHSKSIKAKHSSKSKTSDADKQLNGLKIDQIDDEELTALKQVCLSYIDMIEFVIDSIPEKKETEIEPDFEPIFLQLKTFVTNAKRQLGRQEIDANKGKEERTLKLNAQEIEALPDLPFEQPSTPHISLSSMEFDDNNTHTATYSLSDTPTTTTPLHSRQSTMSSAFRKITGRASSANRLEDESFKQEKERIKKEIKLMKQQLKIRKFELLSNNIWYNYLLLYLCRSEQFILSSTCKYCQKKCSLLTYNFQQQFEFDNIYWRNNFFNFIHPIKDCTLLINENKFELLTNTQKRQLKYYIKFWNKFIIEKENKKKLKQIENKMDAFELKKEDNNIEEKKHNNKEEDNKEENNNNNNIEFEIEENNNDNMHVDDVDNKTDEKEEDDDLLDLYGDDGGDFEYDSSDDRPKGIQLLDKYRQDFKYINNQSSIAEDASLAIAIPTDIEQLIISDCKNKNGELSNWLSSLLCYIPFNCPIDYICIENNNFQDRDIHRICAGLLNRKKQSNLIGLSLCKNTNITDKAIHILLKTISKKCHKLQFLKLSNCVKLTNRTCQTILDFYSKTYNDDNVQLSYIDLSNNYKINDKGIHILNQIYLHQQYTPTNVVVRFYMPGTQWQNPMDDWSKNIILKPPKRR